MKFVSCGYRHTLILTKAGYVYAMGDNRKHEMGFGDSARAQEKEFISPVKLSQLEIHKISSVVAGGFSAAVTDNS